MVVVAASPALTSGAGLAHAAGQAAGGVPGYGPGPWPCEDGGPARRQAVPGALGVDPGAGLEVTSRRTWLSTMAVLGAPGEVYLLSHAALRSHVGLGTHARVERIHPETLAPLARSPRLAGGPMWPGSLAVHASGDLHVVYGNHVHRLDRHCQPLATRQLPGHEPCNGFVVLPGGALVTKNLSRRQPARLTVLHPRTLEPLCPPVVCPEPSVARLGVLGDAVYVVGIHSVTRYHWDAARARLRLDTDWRWDYLAGTGNSFGWDLVLAGGHAWFMDNGDHNYLWTMRGAGRRHTPNRLLRVSLQDARDHQAWEVSGRAGGSVTNPPLVDLRRGIVLAFDSANAHLRAWTLQPGGGLEPRWERPGLGCASHMLLYEESGEVVTNDHQGLSEQVVVLDIDTGREKARARTGGRMQGVVFPSPGWNGDFYWCSMDRIARVRPAAARTASRPA